MKRNGTQRQVLAAIVMASGLAVGLTATSASGQVVAGVENTGIQMQVYDVSSSAYVSPINQGSRLVTSLAADDAGRRLFFSTRSQLWTIPYDAPQTPVLIGTFNGAATQLFGGLAWDSTTNTLYGTSTTQLYTVDIATAALTQIRTVTSGDMGGLDYRTENGKLYFTQDGATATAPLVGRGLYSIDPPFDTGTIALVTAYPTGETDIDGLAVGGGRAYLIEDETNSMHVYDFTSGTYVTTVAQTAFGTDRITCGGTYAASIFVAPTGVNVGVSISSPGLCEVSQGGAFAYTISLTNNGADPANNVTLAFTLPSATDASFVSSVPAGVPSGGVLTLNLGTLAGGGASTAVTVNMTALTAGATLASSAVVTLDETDTNPANNSASNSFGVTPVAPSEAPIKGVFHDYAALAGSDVPGISGVKFATFDRPYGSPDRSKLILRVDTEAPTTSDGMILVYDGTAWSVAAREGDPIAGVTPAVAINQIDDATGFDEPCAVNNAGSYAYSGNFEGTASDDFVVKNVGGTNTLVCDEDATSAAFIGGGATTFNDVTGSVTIAPDNSVTWHGTISGVPTPNDTVLVRNDGTVVMIQEGITVPTNQFAPGPVATSSPWSGTIVSTAQAGLSFNADHTSWLALGTLATPTVATNDEIAAVNLDVKVQEDIAFNPPYTDLVLDIDTVTMAPNGDWYIHGDNDGGLDFLIRNGEVIAQTDQPVPGFPGEFYDDPASLTYCFYAVAGNANGDYVFGAITNNPDPLRDAVLVYNGTTVIARQNDPVDLDNNGLFDDDAYIRTFNDHNILLSNTDCYVTVTLRRGLAALCGGSDAAQSGDAFIRIPLPVGNNCPLDLSGNEIVDADDIFAFLSFWFDGPPGGTCTGCLPDWNDDGNITADDIFAYLSDWFAFGPGLPCP